MKWFLKNWCSLARVCGSLQFNWIDRGLPYSEVEQGTKKVKRFDTDEVKEWIKENSK